MELVDETIKPVIDTDAIKKGDLIWTKHKCWQEARTGIVSFVSPEFIRILYHPRIANVTTYFTVNINDLVDGKWEIKWSDDFENIWKYPSGAVKVDTAEALQEAINDDSVTEIMLTADINGTGEEDVVLLDSGLEKILDLNGHKITATYDNPELSCAAIKVIDGVLTITGEGEVYGGSGSHDNIAVWAYSESARIIIKGGDYDTFLDKDGDVNSTIYAEDKGTVEIEGGTFENFGSESIGASEPKMYVLNVRNNDGSYIICRGGTYRNQNPANGDDADRATGDTFLADGYTVIEEESEEDTFYTVVPE